MEIRINRGNRDGREEKGSREKDGREEKDSSRKKDGSREKNSREEKDGLRRRIKALRREVSPSEKALWDRQLKENFFRLFDRQPAQDLRGPVYLYLDFGNEAGTREIFSELWKRGIRTAAPRVEETKPGVKEMVFYLVREWGQLSPGYMGILEPDLSAGVLPADSPEALVAVPGVAFDWEGCRLGYGGGFYDRFFLKEPGHPKWGLAYGFQMAEKLPREPWDQKMDAVLTPEEIVICGSRERAGRI